MSDMIINNMGGGSFLQSQTRLMQEDLAKASVEYTKQRGIMKELMNILARKKVAAINDMYKDTTVFHDKYGACRWKFVGDVDTECIIIRLQYWVKSVPSEGLSKADAKVAELYGCSCFYESAVERARRFKSFDGKYELCDSVQWVYTIEDIVSPDFLKKGIMANGNTEPFSINLNE